MAYVDAIHDRNNDRIHVVERVKGERIYREYPATYTFYHNDPRGKFRTIYDTPVTRFSTHNYKEYQKELRIHKGQTLWESDINPIFRLLSEHYLGADSPRLHACFFDIEVDFDPVRGFAPPEDPFNPITSISLYMDWNQQLITLAIPPKGLSWDSAQEIASKYDNCFLFEREEDMLTTFLDLIDDADVLSGWNSEGFDIPYMVMRTIKILSKDDTRRFCLWNQLPRKRTFERFGAEHITFDLYGRVHLDYMQLYRKYTYEERHSYSLDAIGEYEGIGSKVAYDGTLDQLYNREFGKFLDYNRQDVMLLARMDEKLRFLDLANEIAHDNTVLLPTVLGAVAVTEQAIINEAHARNMIVPNRRDHGNDTQAAGAYVAYPKQGMHRDIGAIDLNSLYPSTLRALNMSTETIVAQLRSTMTDAYIEDKIAKGSSFADAWENLFGTLEYTAVMEGRTDVQITVDWEDGRETVLPAVDVWRLIFQGGQPWCLTANGTIFRYDIKGVIPGLLERWYAERKQLQKKKKQWQNLLSGIELPDRLKVSSKN